MKEKTKTNTNQLTQGINIAMTAAAANNMTLMQSIRAAMAELPPTDLAVELRDLNFDFGSDPILTGVTLSLP